MKNDKVEEIIKHYGTSGMKWGFNDGKPNGKRKAGSDLKEELEEKVDVALGTDKIGKELGDVINVALGGKGNLKREYRQLKAAVNKKVSKISKDVKKRGERILLRMFGPAEKKKIIL